MLFSKLTVPSQPIIFFFVISVFLPYIGFSFLPSDLQPLYLILSLLIIIKSGVKSLSLNKAFWPLYLITLLGAMLTIFKSIMAIRGDLDIFPGYPPLSSLTRLLVAYLSPILVCQATYLISDYLQFNKILVNRIFHSFIFVIFFGYLLNILGMSDIIQIFVNRAIYTGGESVRGLTSFFSEQANIVEQCAAMLCFLNIYGYCTRKSFFLLLASALPSASGQLFMTIILAFLVFIFALLVRLHKTTLVLFGFISICLATIFSLKSQVSSLIDNLVLFGVPSRGLLLVRDLFFSPQLALAFTVLADDAIIVKISGLTGAAAVLLAQPFNIDPGSYMTPSLMSSIHSAHYQIEHLIFGSSTYVGFDRPYGPLGSIVIDFGVLGLLMVLPCIAQLVKLSFLNRKNIYYFVSVLFVIYFLLLRMPLSHPVPWFLYASVISLSSYNKKTPQLLEP